MKRESTGLQIAVTKLDGDRWLRDPAPPLNASEIHVWDFPSAVAEPFLSQCRELLSAEERERASRFHFERDAHRFSVTRSRTRSILSAYLQSPARDLRFVYSEHGKPSVPNPPEDIRFNVSHSGDRALVAVALGREVGVDIEQIRTNVEVEQLAEKFFSPTERQFIREQPGEEKLAAFFRCWTCKEAFLKGQGVGLSRSLASFDVVFGNNRERLVPIRVDSVETRWSLLELETLPGYAAATAVEGSPRTLKVFQLQ